ncbi:hypothetical protein OEZ86_000007 [Tetradesmus obliquus]|uniref:DUF1664 domain-containing protein n=1 Tax=Tetradesmus obliquus TaxID=3088 RepID=A0A383VS81_TETOB|nr:hypothetical protein OEZ86_000007 [Tetradesmus obliquus]|eukprot:jgi/Sobl393_1/16005/SZX68378.1
MAMFKGLLGGAAGAAVYTAYRDSETIFSSKDLASGVYELWQKKGATNIAEVSRLQRNVDDLQHALLKTLHDRQQPTVIVTGNGKSGANTAAGFIVVVGGVALYLRFVKGWRLADLMYVTRSSLASMTDSMKQSMDKVRSQFEARAAELMERMGKLSGKQEELLEAQGQLGSELAVVGGKVSAVSDQVGFSNHAILLLCGALSEMAKRVGISNGKYVRELEHLSRSVATTGLPAGAMGASGALPAMMAMDPFQPAQQLQPSLLTLPTASAAPAAAAGMAGSSWVGPNPAVLQYSTSFGADAGARSAENIAAGAGMRGMTEPAVMLSGSSDPWGTGSRQQPTPKQPAW